MPTTLVSRSFSDFVPGTEVRTRARTITEADIVAHAALSWDFYPLHTDEEYARTTRFGRRIAHGHLVHAVSMGLMPIDFFGDALVAFIGVDNQRFTAPVFAGDTIEVHATVRDASLTSSGQTGIVTVDYVTKNQRDDTVMEMTARFLMRNEP
jgi:acyl dehydratase